MGLYFIYLVMLVLAAIASVSSRAVVFVRILSNRIRFDKFIYPALLLFLGVMLCLRYNQGSDYMGYYAWYEITSSSLDASQWFGRRLHAEAGWVILNQIFKSIGFPFAILIAFVSVIEIWQIHKFIERYCSESRCFVLMFFYPVFVLIYMFSAIRQGLVMCFFIGTLIQLLEERKYKKYFLITIILMFIHEASVIYFFVLAFHAMHFKIPQVYLRMVLYFSVGIGMGIAVLGVSGGAISQLIERYIDVRYSYTEVSYGALLRRLVFIGIIIYINKRSCINKDLYAVYMLGSAVFFLLSARTFIATRFFEMIGEGIEVFFICHFINNQKKRRNLLVLFLIVYVVYMYFKNVNFFIASDANMGLYEGANPISYPFISILSIFFGR